MVYRIWKWKYTNILQHDGNFYSIRPPIKKHPGKTLQLRPPLTWPEEHCEKRICANQNDAPYISTPYQLLLSAPSYSLRPIRPHVACCGHLLHAAAISEPPSSHPIMTLTRHLMAIILGGLSTFIVPAFAIPKTISLPSRLNITSIAAADGKSTLECWQLSAALAESSQAGTSGAAIAELGETGATSYSLLPPHFDGGLHNAPAVQYVLRSSQSSSCLQSVPPVILPTSVRFSSK